MSSTGEGLGPTWPSPSPASPIHNEDLLIEILLRLSPLPSSLPRASAVCTRWHRIVTDPSFLRRYRAHHWKPYGFFLCGGRDNLTFTSISDARRHSMPEGHDGGDDDYTWEFCGCRHGRVLLADRRPDDFYGIRQVQVWNPASGKRYVVAVPQFSGSDWKNTVRVQAAVVCTSGDKGPFQVALAWGDRPRSARAYACVYSSETGEWGDVVSAVAPSRCFVSVGSGNVMIGNSLYWILWGMEDHILELDLASHNLAVIEVPLEAYDAGHRGLFLSTLAKDGGLSLVVMSEELEARLWVRTMAGSDGVAGWMLGGTIELGKLLSLRSVAHTYPVYQQALWVAGDDNLLFVWTHRGLFMVHLESIKFEKIFEANPFGTHGTIHPFIHLYVPGRILEGRHAGARNNCKENEKLVGAMQRGYLAPRPSGRMGRYAGEKVKRVLETNLERNQKRVKQVETGLGRHS